MGVLDAELRTFLQDIIDPGYKSVPPLKSFGFNLRFMTNNCRGVIQRYESSMFVQT